MTGTPVLWVTGPAGAGKTTVAWLIYTGLSGSGAEVGYVDIDQLGMCYPEPAEDPGRHRIAADNLAAVVAGYRAAGARAVVVSGVVDPARGVPVDRLPDVVVTTCRLRAAAGDLRRRLVARRADAAFVDAALAEAEALDAGAVGDLCIDTSGRSIEEVVALVRQRTAGWADRAPTIAAATVDEPYPDAGGPILWVCGPTGVGKSTAGFSLYLRHVLNAGIVGAYVDLDQIGFYRPATAAAGIDHAMRAGILAGMWRTFRISGAECLIVVGPAGNAAAITAYARAMPATTITVCRLHASAEELARRILRRGEGHGSWAQPGDRLTGRSAGYLSAVAARAAAEAEALDRAAVGDVRIDTDRLTAEEVADAIAAETGWPVAGRRLPRT